MKNQKPFVLVIFAALIFACLQTAALGQTASPSKNIKVASVRTEGMGVRFDSAIPYSSATLTVSAPDGNVYRRDFAAGSAPSFALLDKTGLVLGNGQYTYELRFTTVQMLDFKQRLTADSIGGGVDVNGRTNSNPTSVQSVVQSGSFAVQNGVLYVGNETEPTSRRSPLTKSFKENLQPPRVSANVSGNAMTRLRNHRLSLFAMPDQVIADNLIVQGSACIGLDCVNNESFGFDTVRLKENNTRLKFEDTSTAVGFPTHDWQLTANDSASGGAEKFSIEDITAGTVPFTVTGSAPSNSIFVDSTGRVGFRTSTPVLDLHTNTGNTPAIRFEQNGSGGFTAQTWDIGANEANFFVRDVTGGSRLPFRIRPGAPTSSIDISAAGNVGIGTPSPAQFLDVVKSQNAGSMIRMTNSDAGTASQSVVDALSDSAEIALQSHALARTITRYGVTVGGFVELNAVGVTGYLSGPSRMPPLLFSALTELNVCALIRSVALASGPTHPISSYRSTVTPANSGADPGWLFRMSA
jgi:hypothetical protein